MNNVLLVDFGSTYTKVTAVDLEEERLIGTSSAFTTVATDINHGLSTALNILKSEVGEVEFSRTYACSSAAGGLRMMASGLVPDLTSQAAKMASLGAGAKLIKTFAYEMTEEDIEEIERENPEIFLLAGGTDGGNTDCILHNAELLGKSEVSFPIILAGNRNAARKCQQLLEGKLVHVVDNVMPKFGVINIQPAQEKIREVFLERIIKAKGLSKASQLISDIMMPTPSAIMEAMNLLALGTEREPGIGELMAVDVGGATTDVYSVASGEPRAGMVVYKGLPEPYIKRTVEGDIGMRYSIDGIVEAAGIKRLAQLALLEETRAGELVDYLKENKDAIPDTLELKRLDIALAKLAVEIATIRHAGHMEETYTPAGLTFVQSGKDLREVKRMVVTGGSLIHNEEAPEIARSGFFNQAEPQSLRPVEGSILVDRKYILAAMGILSKHAPEVALRIMKKELICYGDK